MKSEVMKKWSRSMPERYPNVKGSTRPRNTTSVPTPEQCVCNALRRLSLVRTLDLLGDVRLGLVLQDM